jgi:outer membrane protein assembly factor BamD
VLAKSWVRSPAVFAVLAAAIVLSGCSLLNRPKKTTDAAYQEAPVDQLYAAGAEHLDKHLWNDAVTYFKEVERQHPYSEWSRRAILMQAFAHYEANQYSDAVSDANRFIELYPGNASASYAYYLKAECYFEQILDVGRDQAATEQARAAMREVVQRYPNTEYAVDARLKIDMIADQLAGKEMSIGRWYLRQGDMISAIGRFKVVISRYQTTSHTPEALERLVEAYLTLGLVGEAKENAAVLGYNFPGDVWYADAYRLMTDRGLRPEVAPTRTGKHGRHFLPFQRGKDRSLSNAPAPSTPPPAATADAPDSSAMPTPAAAPAMTPTTPAAPMTPTTPAPMNP